MTNEQIIILALFAAAFLAGWVTHALTAAAARRLRAPADATLVRLTPLSEERFEAAVDESRRELERAIRAYHTTVAVSLEDGDQAVAAPTSLEVLVRALAALSIAVEHASRELAGDEALAGRLHATGSELRELAQEVLLHEADAQLPQTMFDRLEQHLMAAAAVILVPGRLQPHPA